MRVRGRVKLRGIGNLSRYPSFLPSCSFGGKRAGPLQKEVRERCDRSNAGYYKTKDDGSMPIIEGEGRSARRGWARERERKAISTKKVAKDVVPRTAIDLIRALPTLFPFQLFSQLRCPPPPRGFLI